MQRLTTLADRAFGRTASWRVIAGLVIAFALTNVLIFGALARFEQAAGGLPLLELPSLSPPSGLVETARAYPPEAARIYRTEIQPLDLLFPLAAGLLFGNTIYLLSTTLAGAATPWRALSLLGIAATLCDWLENLGVFVLLRTADTPPLGIASLIRAASLIKFAAGSVAVVCILVLFALLLSRRLGHSGRSEPGGVRRP